MASSRPGSDPRSLARRPADTATLLGQVWTPHALAQQMARKLLRDRPARPIAILDPAVGPATFPAALAETRLLTAGDELVLYDIDPRMTEQTTAWSKQLPCRCQTIRRDYLQSECGERFDLAILNPPYVRQEWIEEKEKYRDLFKDKYAVYVPGTANLYVYFLVKVVRELKPGGAFVAIVYDSWQSTRFGAWLSRFLETECEAIERVSVSGQPFRGRLIDATILYARRRMRPHFLDPLEDGCPVRKEPAPFATIDGFVPLDRLFHSKRGLRLKQADFFLAGPDDVRRHGATPFVKKIAGIRRYRVPEDHPESALLVSLRHADPRVLRELERRLRLARKRPAENVSILTWFRERRPSWALHREPPHAPFLFNYYLRKRPRHLHNPSRAYADNFYGLTPLDAAPPMVVLAVLNSTCVAVEILAQARNQGSGLAKVQLFEYRQIHVPDWRRFRAKCRRALEEQGAALATHTGPAESMLEGIDRTLSDELGYSSLELRSLQGLYQEVDQRARTPFGSPWRIRC